MRNTNGRLNDVIILASTSPTRRALLANAGLRYESIAPDIDEKALLQRNPHWTPAEASRRLAKSKSVDVSQHHPNAIVIGADQVLACEGQIFGKPVDADHCREQLTYLRGKDHFLISSVVCALNGFSIWAYAQTATMTMRNFSDAFLVDYLQSVGPRCTSSVGGYQLENQGIQLFDNIDGDYFAILGLPMIPLLNFLRFVKAIPS